MATARDLITSALLDLSVIAEGETPSTAATDSGLDALNALLDQFRAERLMIHTITRTTWTISSGTGTYTVGTGGNVNVARPVSIDHVGLIDTSTTPDTEHLLTPLSDDDYARIPYKAQTATQPTHWYYNPTVALGSLILWPSPTDTTLQGALYARGALTEFADLTTDYALPPGYRRAFIKNLAMELAPSYGRQTPQELAVAALEAKSIVKRANIRVPELQFEAAVLGSSGGAYDITQG